MTIQNLLQFYLIKIDQFEAELLIAHVLRKPREFVLAHPEKKITKKQETITKNLIERRMRGEPIAYIIKHKEFYGLDFVVDKNTLIPRPETEQIIELTLNEISNFKFQISNLNIVDVGTGSGNIIISIANELEKNTRYEIPDTKYYATDISKDALKIARKNAKVYKLDKKINFLQGNLLSPLLKAKKLTKLIRQSADYKLIVVANLPYLSQEIYDSTSIDVKKYEPKSALYSANAGLAHYEKLLKQIKKILATDYWLPITVFLEFSPEQKQLLQKLIKNIFPSAKISFFKDLAGKWRVCKINFK